jgi:hypothetical protein
MPVKRRRLNDLYVVGRPVIVGEDTPEPVEIWLQKLNPVQNEDALRRANAARTRARAFGKDKDSEEYLDAVANVNDFASREVLIDLSIAEELRLRRSRIEAECAAEDEWAADDYLQGLVDEWEGTPDAPGLKERWAEDHDDPEAARVKSEIDRFDEKVRVLVEAEHENLKRDYENTPDDVVLDKAVERVLEQRAVTAFILEYENWQLYYAVRDPDHHTELYFENVEQVKSLEERTKEILLLNYRELMVEQTEGKDSPGTPGSSPSSEPAEPAETDPSSGLQAVRL